MDHISHTIETGFNDQEEDSSKLMMNKYSLYGFANVQSKLFGRDINEDEIEFIRTFNRSYQQYTYYYPILTFGNCDDEFTNWISKMQNTLLNYMFQEKVIKTQTIQSVDDVYNIYSFIQDMYISIFIPLYNISYYEIPDYEYSQTILQEYFQNGTSATLLEAEKKIEYPFEVMACMNYDEFHQCYHIMSFVPYTKEDNKENPAQDNKQDTEQEIAHRYCSICGDSDEQISQRPNQKEMVCFDCCKDKPYGEYYCQRCLVAYLHLKFTTSGRYHSKYVEIVVCPSCRCPV